MIITSVGADEVINNTAEKIYRELTEAGIECLWDDRDIRGGVKFKDADLLGIPVRVTIGKKSVADGCVEIKPRANKQSKKVAVEEAKAKIIALVRELYAQLNK